MDHNHHSSCSCGQVSRSVNQTLDELDFERGIWHAALNGESGRVDKLLQNGTDPNIVDNSGYTALHYSCRNNQCEVTRLLLNHGADVNQPTRSGGAYPLHRAAYMGHADIVKLLLENGAKPANQDKDGKTALHKAAENGHIKTCGILIERDPALTSLNDNNGQVAAGLVPSGRHDLKLLLTP